MNPTLRLTSRIPSFSAASNQGNLLSEKIALDFSTCIPIQWSATHIDTSTVVAALTGGFGVIAKSMRR